MDGSLITRVKRRIVDSGVPERGARILVAVSGGQDSVCLLHLLLGLRHEFCYHLHVAHVNHLLRADESDEDARFVLERAGIHSVPASIESIDVAELATRLGLSKQVAAREARHEFLRRVATENQLDWIALGHTSDDRAETLLMNIMRGSGLDGLAALPHVRGRIIRPLIDLSRQETGDYCRNSNVAFREDYSNLSLSYRRNRVRLELLPYIRQNFNPNIEGALLRLANIAEQDAALLNRLTEQAFQSCLVRESDHEIAIDATSCTTLDPALQSRVIRFAVLRLRGQLEEINASPVYDLLEHVGHVSQKRWLVTLPGGDIRIESNSGELRIVKLRITIETPKFCHTVAVPGSTRIEETDVEVLCTTGFPDLSSFSDKLTERAVFDMDRLELPLRIRNRRAGDRISPKGLGGSKKLQDLFVDRKVPLEVRDRTPILEDERGILWVVGHAVADRAVITDSTARTLIVEVVDAAGEREWAG